MQIAHKHQMAGVMREIASKRSSQSTGGVRRKINDSHLIPRAGEYHGTPGVHGSAGGVLLQLPDGKGRSWRFEGIKQLLVERECLGLCDPPAGLLTFSCSEIPKCLNHVRVCTCTHAHTHTHTLNIENALVVFNPEEGRKSPEFNSMVIKNFKWRKKVPN